VSRDKDTPRVVEDRQLAAPEHQGVVGVRHGHQPPVLHLVQSVRTFCRVHCVHCVQTIGRMGHVYADSFPKSTKSTNVYMYSIGYTLYIVYKLVRMGGGTSADITQPREKRDLCREECRDKSET
jgi:hypothetical protein